jgi:hypothetical protein
VDAGRNHTAGIDDPGASPSKEWALWLSLLVLAAAGIAAAHGADSWPPRVVRPPRVVQVESEDVRTLPSDGSPTLILAGRYDLVPEQFITAAPDWESHSPHTPDGFLLKVLSADFDGEETVVKTRPASLFEAEPEGRIEARGSDFQA